MRVNDLKGSVCGAKVKLGDEVLAVTSVFPSEGEKNVGVWFSRGGARVFPRFFTKEEFLSLEVVE
jgi:hypothetical protein